MTQLSAWCRASVVPLERWDIDAPLSGTGPHAAPARFGGWLRGAALFDAELFGMAAADASRAVDPQQRLILESFRQARMTFQARCLMDARLCLASISMSTAREPSDMAPVRIVLVWCVPAVLYAGSRQQRSDFASAVDHV